jgi:hypothetical protein
MSESEGALHEGAAALPCYHKDGEFFENSGEDYPFVT